MWKTISINKNQIKAETGKAVLIAMPHKSDYDGYSFWHSAKLVRDGKHSAAVSISYTDDFVFRLKKYGKGRFNRNEVIDEIPIAADEFEMIFSVTDENITASVNPYETHKPQELTAVTVEVPEDLKDE